MSAELVRLAAASVPPGTIHPHGCRSPLPVIALPRVLTPRLMGKQIQPIALPEPEGCESAAGHRPGVGR